MYKIRFLHILTANRFEQVVTCWYVMYNPFSTGKPNVQFITSYTVPGIVQMVLYYVLTNRFFNCKPAKTKPLPLLFQIESSFDGKFKKAHLSFSYNLLLQSRSR
jgi:hypothetical protein